MGTSVLAPLRFGVVQESELLVDDFSDVNLLSISLIRFSVFDTRSTKVTSSWLLRCNSLSTRSSCCLLCGDSFSAGTAYNIIETR